MRIESRESEFDTRVNCILRGGGGGGGGGGGARGESMGVLTFFSLFLTLFLKPNWDLYSGYGTCGKKLPLFSFLSYVIKELVLANKNI